MITLILCLRPLRVPKFIWFKILHSRRYEFGPEMSVGDDPDDIMEGAYAARNAGLINHVADRCDQVYWIRFFCMKNEVEMMKIFQKYNYTVYGMHWACRSGSLEVFKYVVTLRSTHNMDCLETAVKYHQIEIIKYILENHCPKVESAIAHACKEGFYDILKILLPYSQHNYKEYLEIAREQYAPLIIVKYLERFLKN